MSEDFVRCTNCGNLNIAGTTKCVFCDTDIDENAEVFKEHADDPSVSELPGEPPVIKEATSTDYPEMPAMPEMPSVEVADKKKDSKKEAVTEPTHLKEYSSGLKFLYMTLIFFALSILHYFLNLLVALASYDPADPNISLSLNVPANLSSILFIKGSSVILGIPFAIIIGYILAGVIAAFVIETGFINLEASREIVDVFSQFGIAFLLFIVGLHLNPKIIKEIGIYSLLIGIV